MDAEIVLRYSKYQIFTKTTQTRCALKTLAANPGYFLGLLVSVL